MTETDAASRNPPVRSILQTEIDGVTCAVYARSSADDLPAPDAADRRTAESRFLAELFDIAPERVFALRQVHGIETHRIGHAALERKPVEPGIFAEGDALITAEPNTLLVIRTADCMPVFFILRDASHDPFAVGIVHAGWRGLRDSAIEAALQKACQSFGAPARVELRIGPAIGGKAYEVGRDVADQFPIITPRPGRQGKFWLDMVANAEARLLAWERASRIPVDIIDDLRGCTYTENDLYFSHRRGDAGRNLNCIIMRGAN